MPPESARQAFILVVDDEASVRNMLLMGMRRAGYNCEAVSGGADALEFLEKKEADVVITDVMMPEMGGLELTERIKEKYRSDVIVITAYAEGIRYEEVIQKGASDFVIKPIRNAELLSRIQRVCRERAREEQLQASLSKSRRILNQTVNALSSALEKRDPYTSGHQKRVCMLSVLVAREMGFSDRDIEALEIAGMLHDLGKLWVPTDLLTKPTKLTPPEFELIKVHPQAAYDILKDIEFEGPVAEIVYQHHERLDGTGYPRGLAGDRILPAARILAVADTAEAMASHRPYRPALGIDVVRKTIEQGKGVIFDPEAVEACTRFLQDGKAMPWRE